MTTYPKAHKIIKPPSLRPIRTDTTDIRKTFAAARRQMAAPVVVQVPPLDAGTVSTVVDARAHVAAWRNADPSMTDLGRFNCAGRYVFPPLKKVNK